MAESEVNVILHLLNVEQNSFILTKDAQERANRLVSSARAKADAEFNERFRKISAELDEKFESDKEALVSAHKKELDGYKSKITEIPLNRKDFADFVKKALSKA